MNDNHAMGMVDPSLTIPEDNSTSSPLAKLSAATRALAEARTLDQVKHIMDVAEAARTYARAAKLGLEAANHAAEVKLRAERKAGELLQQLERDKGGRPAENSFQAGTSFSEYRAVLTDSDIAPTTAHRWQTVAQVRALTLQKRIYVGLSDL